MAHSERPPHPSVDCRKALVAPDAAPGDRADMHRDLRERIESDAYVVDPCLVAEAMLRRMSPVLVTAQSFDGDALGIEQRDAASLLDQA